MENICSGQQQADIILTGIVRAITKVGWEGRVGGKEELNTRTKLTSERTTKY